MAQEKWQDPVTQFPLESLVKPERQLQALVKVSSWELDLQVMQELASPALQVRQLAWQVWQFPFVSM